ncbi:MAG: hypothetical protein J4G17_07660 [Anaerolineae bacterium]|nr:hypothetical protein [Anaerolineae bacterium]
MVGKIVKRPGAQGRKIVDMIAQTLCHLVDFFISEVKPDQLAGGGNLSSRGFP